MNDLYLPDDLAPMQFICPRCGSDRARKYWLHTDSGASSCTIGCPCGFAISGRAWDPNGNTEMLDEEEYMVSQFWDILCACSFNEGK